MIGKSPKTSGSWFSVFINVCHSGAEWRHRVDTSFFRVYFVPDFIANKFQLHSSWSLKLAIASSNTSLRPWKSLNESVWISIKFASQELLWLENLRRVMMFPVLKRHVLPRWFSFVKFQALLIRLSNRHMVLKPYHVSLWWIFRIFKSLLQALKNLESTKEQLNLTFSEDLTAVSLVWQYFRQTYDKWLLILYSGSGARKTNQDSLCLVVTVWCP